MLLQPLINLVAGEGTDKQFCLTGWCAKRQREGSDCFSSESLGDLQFAICALK